MQLEHWLQLLFGTVILGTLAFFGTHLFDMRGALSGIVTKLDSTDQRLTRIAKTLPEVQARIAWEEINNSLAGFIATTVPKKTEENKWVSSVKLYDATTGELRTFSLTLPKNHKDFLAYVVAGKVRETNAYAPSFSELAVYSAKERELLSIPEILNSSTSFVLRKVDIDQYSKYLKEVTGQEPQLRMVGHLQNWKEVSAKLGDISKEEQHIAPTAEQHIAPASFD